MLPDFPKLKKKLLKFWNQYGESQMNSQLGFLNQTTRYRHHEGEHWTISREDGSESTSSYKDATAGFSIHNKDVPYLTPARIKQMIDTAMLDMADQVEGQVFQTLMTDLQENDRIISQPGQELTIDTILQGLEEILIDFDADGNANMPSIVVSPEMGEKLKDRLVEWDNDPEIQKRFEELKARKREEWRVRESRRKLVD